MHNILPTRREFLKNTSLGFGAVALSYLLETDAPRDMWSRLGHSSPQAKSVIMLFQNGGASQMDLFDPKPQLQKRPRWILSYATSSTNHTWFAARDNRCRCSNLSLLKTS